MKIFNNYKFNKPFIWFCVISGVIILLFQHFIFAGDDTDYEEIQFNHYMERYVATHQNLFVKEQIAEPKSEIQPLDIPRDDLTWISEKIKEYPENLSDLIANPKPEKINYTIGNINEPILSTEQIVQRNLPASVMVYTNETENSYGTGFIIAPNGIVATSYHLFGNIYDSSDVSGKRGVIILSDNKSLYPIISVLYVDKEKDLIIIKIDGKNKKFPTVKLGNSNLIKPGEKIITIGNSAGFLNTILDGLITGLKKDLTTELIQFSNLIEGGNSGGALFNDRGQVIGIANSGVASSYGINFATPINDLKDLMNK